MDIKASVTLNESSGKTIIHAIGALSDYIGENLMDELIRYSPNQPLLYRHNHPSSIGNGEILGTIIAAEKTEVNGATAIDITAELMDLTQYQKDAIAFVTKLHEAKQDISISIGFQQFGDLAARPFEYSLTEIPVCKECVTYSVVKMEEKDELQATISELRDTLNKVLEEKKALESKMKTMEAPETVDARVQQVVDVISKKYEDKLEAQSVQLERLEKELELSKKQPIISKIFELEQDEQLVDLLYSNMSVEDLTKRLEMVKKKQPVMQVQTERMEQSKDKKKRMSLEEIYAAIPDAPARNGRGWSE